MNKVHLCDCMEFMSGLPDNAYDLAIVDPPYGINQGGHANGSRSVLAESKTYHTFDDSRKPDEIYFHELRRISKNQIIWGCQYFGLPPTSCVVVWDKDNGKNDFSDCELAWTSFNTAVRLFKFKWHGMLQGNMKRKESRIHPTQKPVALYKWLLQNYAKPGQTIFDSHVGSGSIRIACHDLGFDFEGCEIDADYWQAQEDRYKRHAAQGQLFDNKELTETQYTQDNLLHEESL